MKRVKQVNCDSFLCDTWWYGLTSRLSDQKFEELAKLRVRQGFSAVQVVVGIPPEVGPENLNASSKVGPAWNMRGEFNQDYLKNARRRISLLNSLGLSVLVYGAWGQQIEWLGEKKMQEWWREIIKSVDDLDVMYCITGESDIWVGEEKKLLPDKSTDELNTVRLAPFLHPRLIHVGKKLINMINGLLGGVKGLDRRRKWSNILSVVSSLTDKPIFMHVLPNQTSDEVVDNSGLLDAVTVQTGHDPNTRELLWRLPLEVTQQSPGNCFINLEPWYEGIVGKFGKEDQVYAYWSSMMAGAHAYCYGAHGIWNVGDGQFLAHWGKQTFAEAMCLDTPRLIGISHQFFIDSGFMDFKNVEIEDEDGKLIKISRAGQKGRFVTYIPEILLVKSVPKGRIFLPLEARFVKNLPKNGQVVIFSS